MSHPSKTLPTLLTKLVNGNTSTAAAHVLPTDAPRELYQEKAHYVLYIGQSREKASLPRETYSAVQRIALCIASHCVVYLSDVAVLWGKDHNYLSTVGQHGISNTCVLYW